MKELTSWLSSHDKIIMQYVNIYIGIIIMALIATRFKKMKYGFDVVVVRYIKKDIKPIRWLRYHLIFIYYVGFELYMLMRTIGLIEQIRFNLLGSKPDIFFISGPMGLLFFGLILQYFFPRRIGIKRPLIG